MKHFICCKIMFKVVLGVQHQLLKTFQVSQQCNFLSNKFDCLLYNFDFSKSQCYDFLLHNCCYSFIRSLCLTSLLRLGLLVKMASVVCHHPNTMTTTQRLSFHTHWLVTLLYTVWGRNFVSFYRRIAWTCSGTRFLLRGNIFLFVWWKRKQLLHWTARNKVKSLKVSGKRNCCALFHFTGTFQVITKSHLAHYIEVKADICDRSNNALCLQIHAEHYKLN